MKNTAGIRHFLAASFVIAIALIICALIARSTIIRVKSFGRTISVTGAAFKPIRSDFAVWDASLSVTMPDLESAYSRLDRDIKMARQFLANNGFTEADYEVKGVQIMKQYDRDRQPTGFMLSQSIRLELDDVDRIKKLSLDASTLIEKGVELTSFNPRYLFTGLDTLKLEMIRAATENARMRAQQLAETTGRKVGAPTSAGVGVFQIRPLHSQEVSSYGISDVSSIEKEIVCTVHISFLIE